MTGNRSARERMVRNIRTLLLARGWSESYLAKRAHMPQRSLNNIMHPESAINPTIETAEKIARGLGVPMWTLFLNELSDDPRLWRQLDRIIDTYRDLSDEGRDMVLRALELESRYHRT